MLAEIFNEADTLFRTGAISVAGIQIGGLNLPFIRDSASRAMRIEQRESAKTAELDARQGMIALKDQIRFSQGAGINMAHHLLTDKGTALQRYVTRNGDMQIDCVFAPNFRVSSVPHVHDYLPGVGIREQERKISREAFLQHYNKPIVIGDDVWLGANVVLMPGVVIGSHVVIGANSMVNTDIPSGTIAAGVPVRIIKKRPGFEGLADA